MLAVLAAHFFAARYSTMPVYWEDETGYLSNALVMSGGHAPSLGGGSYYIGWSLLLTPLWWISSDPAVVYRIAVLLSATVGAAVTLPLALIARRLGVATPWAILLGAVVAIAPSRVVMSNFVLSENFLTFLVAFAAWAALRYHSRPTIGRAAVLGALSSWVFLTHGRATPLLIATCLWFLLSIRRARWRAIVGLATAILPSVAGFLVYRVLSAEMYSSTINREGEGLDRLFTPDISSLLQAATGQVWYSTVTWFGLALIGAILLGGRFWRELRRRRPGIGTWGAISLVGVLIVSTTFIADPIARGVHRYDLLSYGRYLDPFTTVIALVGIAAIWHRLSKKLSLAVVVIVAVIGAVQVLVLMPLLPTGDNRWWAPITNAGLLQYPWPNVTAATGPPYLIASVAALAAVVAIFLLRKWPLVIVVLFAAVLATSSYVAEKTTVRPFFAHFYQDFTLRTTLQAYAGDPISFDVGGLGDQTAQGTKADTVSRNAYQFWLSGKDVPVFSSDTSAPPTELVISRKDWSLASGLGARLIAVDSDSFDNALWVLPGALQDRLASEGKLLN